MFSQRAVPRDARESAALILLLTYGQVLWKEDMGEGAPGISLVKPEVDDHAVREWK